ncbi:MAG: galactokinase [Chloroflexota bacterium]|nr:galactokinase [Chloroflexota bacterium]
MLDTERLHAALARAYPDADAAAARLVRAPGRVNLIGEHTDYNDGFVLPAAINLETWIAAVPSDDRRVELTLADGSRDGFDLDEIGPLRDSWIDTVAGMAWSLEQSGVVLHGLRGAMITEIPIGSGLSSSAAFQLAAAWALAELLPPMQPMDLARAAQRAENEYVGVRSGIMDQFASAHGRPDAALLLDCRTLHFREVVLPTYEYALVVCDTRSPRSLGTSEYNARRAECEAAVKTLSRRVSGVRSLRDVDMDMLDRFGAELDPVALRRATHVVAENERVSRSVAALDTGQVELLGELWAESHRSLRELYEVTSPELDALVEIATGTSGVVAARMTGAGFGGCTVNLVEREAVDELRKRVEREYEAMFGRSAGFHLVEPAIGAGEVAGS